MSNVMDIVTCGAYALLSSPMSLSRCARRTPSGSRAVAEDRADMSAPIGGGVSCSESKVPGAQTRKPAAVQHRRHADASGPVTASPDGREADPPVGDRVLGGQKQPLAKNSPSGD